MPVYDLMLKLEGLKALCGDGVTDNDLSMVLFPYKWEEEHRRSAGKPGAPIPEKKSAPAQRSDLSRLKAGKLAFTERLKSVLTEEFNARIKRNVLPPQNDPDLRIDLIRNEDWERPIHELFGHLAKGLGQTAPSALARAHAGIKAALHGLAEYRERDHALLIADYDPSDAERYRFPDTARPLDPIDQLPSVPLRAGQPMIATLVREVSEQRARGWLFYIRDPDIREGLTQSYYIWDQALHDMVYWHPGGAFEIGSRFIGPLPGFPTTTAKKPGEVTAYLIVEPLESSAVADFLREGAPAWDQRTPPSFEGFANLVTAKMRLFQRGNVGTMNYPPPKLYMRRYRINA